jgi:hypothetical protein
LDRWGDGFSQPISIRHTHLLIYDPIRNPVTVFGFLMSFGAVNVELTRLLRVRYLPDSQPTQTPLGQILRQPLDLHNAGLIFERDVALVALTMLVEELKDVEKADPKLLASFRRRFREMSLSGYFGVRQELQIAALLIRGDIDFEYELRGKPDFTIPAANGTIGIECTTAHVERTEPRGDLSYKVEAAIRQKARRPYADHTVALSIERTAIDALQSADARKRTIVAAESAVASSSFGSVILHTKMVNEDVDPPRFECNYNRIDSPQIDQALKSALDRLFPMGHLEVKSFRTPRSP